MMTSVLGLNVFNFLYCVPGPARKFRCVVVIAVGYFLASFVSTVSSCCSDVGVLVTGAGFLGATSFLAGFLAFCHRVVE